MQRWIPTVVVCVGVAFGPFEVEHVQAGQLSDDLHEVSRSRLPPVEREELDVARRDAYDTAMRNVDSDGMAMDAAGLLRLPGSGRALRVSGPLGRRLTELGILTTARELD